MIKTVAEVDLPVDEKLIIQKMRIEPKVDSDRDKRISIVTGTHGDELEGQYVCYELQRIIKENQDHLHGIVDIYPALNPLGIDSITRGIPQFDLDMNRTFPGNKDGMFTEYVTSEIMEDLIGSSICIDIHASNIFLRELPQVRISEETAMELVPYAQKLNVDFIWVHEAATVLESTLAHAMNASGVPTLVVEMGVGMRITKEYCTQLVEGILSVMHEINMWDGPITPVREPLLAMEGDVGYLNASASGIFVPLVEIGAHVRIHQKIGEIVNPLTGLVEEEICTPLEGIVFTLREYPVVYHGSLLSRVWGQNR